MTKAKSCRRPRSKWPSCARSTTTTTSAIEATLPFRTMSATGLILSLIVQNLLPGTTVEFTWQCGDQEMTGKLAPAPAKNWFDSQRGWRLESMMFFQKAGSFSEAGPGRRKKPSTQPSWFTVRSTVS